MFVWRKRASATWLAANENWIREIAGSRLAIIECPAWKTSLLEITSEKPSELRIIRRKFGGTIAKLPPDWVRRFSRVDQKPLTIGKRLTIVRKGPPNSKRLIIPAGAAFGTGEHATTAMSLRLLEKLTCHWKKWNMLDLGTGSGILALAAARFGAQRVIAVDSDSTAISTARQNARANRIRNIRFQVSDVRKLRFPPRVDVVTANLFSQLLIEILSRLKCARYLILSGILREQEAPVQRVLRRNHFRVKQIRRRGKWIALLSSQ